MLLVCGERLFPGRPVALAIVVIATALASLFKLNEQGVHVVGFIPSGIPAIELPSFQMQHIEGLVELAFACFLLSYVESIAAARTFASKYHYTVDPRQELLGLGAANLVAALGHGYPVAGGLSQSAVNEKAGAQTPLSLIFASVSLVMVLFFMTGMLRS